MHTPPKELVHTSQKTRDKRLIVRLTDDEMARLKDTAKADGVSVSEYVRSKAMATEPPKPTRRKIPWGARWRGHRCLSDIQRAALEQLNRCGRLTVGRNYQEPTAKALVRRGLALWYRGNAYLELVPAAVYLATWWQRNGSGHRDERVFPDGAPLYGTLPELLAWSAQYPDLECDAATWDYKPRFRLRNGHKILGEEQWWYRRQHR